MISCAPYSRGCAPICKQVHRGSTPGSSSCRPSGGSAQECLGALARLAEIVPAVFCPVLQRVAGALEPLVFSSEFTDSDGRRMPYAQFVKTVARKWVLDAKAAESLAKQDLARAMLEVESLEVRGVASLGVVARALLTV